MHITFTRTSAALACLLPFTMAVTLGGCTAVRRDDVCRANCALEITLPSNAGEAPTIPDSQNKLKVAPGVKLMITVSHEDGAGPAQVALLFRKTSAFVSKDKKRPLPVVVLNKGTSEVEISSRRGTCRWFSPCKYEIEDIGNPDRPGLDPWIIIER